MTIVTIGTLLRVCAWARIRRYENQLSQLSRDATDTEPRKQGGINVSQWRVGVWPAMLGASCFARGKRQLRVMCNDFHKALKRKEIADSEHIGVPICTSPTVIGLVSELRTGYLYDPG